MHQTLLAVSAVAAFAYLALGHERTAQRLEHRDIGAKVELAAVDLATARIDVLMGMAFDEGDVGGHGARATPSTIPLGPDAGESGPAAFDDLDDWDGYDAAATARVGRGELAFRERITVRYVEDDRPGTPATGATLSKEVVVTLDEVPGTTGGRAPGRAELRRVITPVGLAIDQSTR